ncbi:hypothetical protein GeomeDRAFT_1234 [Geobacter metallireducens RCH3]|uniref:Uncharacterized protein n=1 Tax=Geobacter metallireducens (strain ATCC 53774 / DSM 7210 / GS-15) TaxID=269799 RepID=Q39Q74_GEOMG|nr:hypothetical protein [Geobacter metallireducens]ABB33600.1 hypothetical protein Gmet_3388 [Geobacter metallireducens GS-15]EHP87710.1 hypothetical protein GeomeDRAFT_1234 [Geobacter metallireducens RCH3]
MKCPKCGYNSFEFLDTCKKCKTDLSGFKQTHGIHSPMTSLAAAAAAPAVAAATVAAAVAAPPAAADENFTWDEPAATATPVPPSIKQGDDIFPSMDLDFATPPPAAPASPPPVSFDLEPTSAAAPPVPPTAQEADLPDFSFDEPAADASATPPSLFGSAPADDDGFASLLETGDSSEETAAAAIPDATPELESAWETPANVFGGFGEGGNEAPPAPQEAGGLDLESFNPSPPTKGPQVELDGFSPAEFDSLFGEPDKP